MKYTEKEPGLLEKISFGLGDFSNNGMFTFVSTYLMFYYTDVACLKLSYISIILLIGRVIDAVCSPIVGVIVDKTNTKYGKCRPFVALGSIPVCLMMILLFSLPQGLSDGKKAAISIGIYALYSILYALMNVPYSTMLSVLSSDYNQRISFNLFKNVGANLGAVFVTATTLIFVSFFSKAGGNGFSKTAILFAVVFLIEILMCVVNTKERVTTQNDSFSWHESVSAAVKNRPWLILCGVQFLTLTSYVTRNQSTLYYAKYYLENETASSLMLTLNSVTAVGMSVILPSIVKKTGMKRCVITGNLIWSLAMLATWMVGKNMVPVIILHTIAAIGFSMATGMVFVMLSQTIDYAQQTTGIRPQGMFTSVLAFVQKMGVACAGLICSQVLAMGNYVANQESNSSAILAIRILFCGLPMILCICTMFLMSMYHLKEDRK